MKDEGKVGVILERPPAEKEVTVRWKNNRGIAEVSAAVNAGTWGGDLVGKDGRQKDQHWCKGNGRSGKTKREGCGSLRRGVVGREDASAYVFKKDVYQRVIDAEWEYDTQIRFRCDMRLLHQ